MRGVGVEVGHGVELLDGTWCDEQSKGFAEHLSAGWEHELRVLGGWGASECAAWCESDDDGVGQPDVAWGEDGAGGDNGVGTRRKDCVRADKVGVGLIYELSLGRGCRRESSAIAERGGSYGQRHGRVHGGRVGGELGSGRKQGSDGICAADIEWSRDGRDCEDGMDVCGAVGV